MRNYSGCFSFDYGDLHTIVGAFLLLKEPALNKFEAESPVFVPGTSSTLIISAKVYEQAVDECNFITL